MSIKNFLEVFTKYIPPSEYVEILLSAENIRSRADKVNRILEVHLDFKSLVPKKTLYDIEAGLREAYKLNIVKIMPHYPEELFDYYYLPEILRETEQIGVVARGSVLLCQLQGNMLVVTGMLVSLMIEPGGGGMLIVAFKITGSL